MMAESKERPCEDLPEEDPEGHFPHYLTKTFPFCGHQVKISRCIGANLGVSAFVWDCARTLCQYFEQEKMSFSGQSVIELGSGTGIVGILATLLGGRVTLTDQPHILKQIKHNLSINLAASGGYSTTVRALLWGVDHTLFLDDYDVILGSDIVYYPNDYPHLLQTLRHLSKKTTAIYLSSELRGCNATRRFHDELIPQYFNCEIVHRNDISNINVYKLTLRSEEACAERPKPE
ncbi:EEF1A lysine methyltransferase 3-like [Leucoraja erinacea]|uniref:EEF1A lysine methyltransferase 3-like n=1 Tax=Leucoraja erinaceus TaxID=7782 RepID=UPI002453D11C|nr:EEF1A lysine methyltransferase 3-like [Leucoraja erinacea]